jgi:hypothetical protein
MENFTKYILFVFTKNDNPKEFSEQIADELSVICDVPNVNFYYGPESSVYTISTLETFEDVKEYVDMILGVDKITYILLPFTSDKMSYKLSENISKKLFDEGISDFMSEKTKNSTTNEIDVRNMIRNHINETFFLDFSKLDEDDDEDEWCEILEFKKINKKPSFDELFNKIADLGIDSLSNDEKNLLNQYTK